MCLRLDIGMFAPLGSYYLLIETIMCCRYCVRPTVIWMVYSLGSSSKWAGRPIYDSCYCLVIVGARPKDTSVLGVRDVSNTWARPIFIFDFDFQYKYFVLRYYSYIGTFDITNVWLSLFHFQL